MVGAKLGNYRLERLIGRGRMGAVYLATDEALLRPTAIKLLAWAVGEAHGQDPVQWFLSEARLVARINDPHVVQIYGAARHGEAFYIAMEYVQGESTDALLTSGGRLAPGVATDIVVQAAMALLAAHRSGVVHRDVKPANLLVGPGGVTKLGDFGMALGAAGLRTGSAQVRAGTPFYTAPEIWRGGGASAASDIYALGATYYHLLTGRPPFEGADVAAVEQAHLHGPVPDPRALVPTLSATCADLVRRMLAKAPGARPQSAQEVVWEGRRALVELGEDRRGGAGAAAVPVRRPRVAAPAAGTTSGPSATSGVGSASAPAGVAGRSAPRVGPGATPLPGPAAGPLAEIFRLVRRPFAAVDPADAPYLGEPLAAVHRRLVGAVQDLNSPLVALVGPRGSGRSTLLRQLAHDVASTRRVVAVDLRVAKEALPLTARLARAAGLAPLAGEEPAALLLRLAEEHSAGKTLAPPLLVLDGVQLPHPTTAGLQALAAACLRGRAATLLLCGEPGLGEALARTGGDLGQRRPAEVVIPPLDHEQVSEYVRAWLRAVQPPGAPALIFSPDALLLLGWRSGGVLERINVLAENVLLLAATERRRTVTSWDAWAAADKERWYDARRPTLPLRAPGWPSGDAVAALDACRRAAGLPPWPRGRPG
jgi:type II secretory pathway predicted ATPase ExeA